jgi:hypothetical protein
MLQLLKGRRSVFIFLGFSALIVLNYCMLRSKYHLNSLADRNALSNAPKLFFVGILTICDSPLRHITRTWMDNFKNETSLLTYKFLLDYDEKCVTKLQDENNRFNDLVYLHTEKQGYHEMIYKTRAFFQYASELNNYKYIIKTDEDAVVHWTKLAAEIKRLDQGNQNTYFGFMKTSPVHVTGKFASPQYKKDTGLNEYPVFANGPMFGVSANLTKILTKINEIYPLPMWEQEDTVIGHWMTMLSVNRIHIPQFAEHGQNCAEDKIFLHPFKIPHNLQKFTENFLTDPATACTYFIKNPTT